MYCTGTPRGQQRYIYPATCLAKTNQSFYHQMRRHYSYPLASLSAKLGYKKRGRSPTCPIRVNEKNTVKVSSAGALTFLNLEAQLALLMLWWVSMDGMSWSLVSKLPSRLGTNTDCHSVFAGDVLTPRPICVLPRGAYPCLHLPQVWNRGRVLTNSVFECTDSGSMPAAPISFESLFSHAAWLWQCRRALPSRYSQTPKIDH